MERNIEMKTLPKITIITVTYNASKHLESTIFSVINQTYPNIEYIIIDGGSKDETVDIIKKYAKHIDYWVSEPDKGIYDAFNKGWKAAKGEWILYLGADDELINTGIEALVGGSESVDVVYGNTILMFPNNREKLLFAKPYQLMRKAQQIPFIHQSLMMKKKVIQSIGGFDESFAICADFDLIVKSLRLGYKFNIVNKTISKFAVTGISQRSYMADFELHKIYRKYNNKVSSLIYLFKKLIRRFLVKSKHKIESYL